MGEMQVGDMWNGIYESCGRAWEQGLGRGKLKARRRELGHRVCVEG